MSDFHNNKNKEYVYHSYDIMADWYNANRSRELFEKLYLEKFVSYLNPQLKILDMGCGMDEPIMRFFLERGFATTGIDGSCKLIEMGRQRLPNARLIIQDLRELDLNESFDGIIAWHSIFHLKPSDQRRLFKIVKKHLAPNGIFLFTYRDRSW